MAEIYYQDIGISDEATFGVSASEDFSDENTRIHIQSITLKKTPTKEPIEETGASNRGRTRFKRLNNDISGDLNMYASPRNMHHAFEMVMGTRGATTALGSSYGVIINYFQSSSAGKKGKSINIDRINSQERANGVLAKSLEISGSDDTLEMSLNVMAKHLGTGASMAELLGETVLPFDFSDVQITVHPGATYGASTLTVKAQEWSVTYDNGLEPLYQSKDDTNDARDPADFYYGIPTIEGNLSILHEGTTYVTSTYGCSVWYMRIEGTLTSCEGLIGGVSAYKFQLDIPHVVMNENTRDYEQSALAVEEISFFGLMDSGASTLFRPQITTAFDNIK